MKKVLAIVAIAAFASCNNGENKNAAADSARQADSIKAAADSIAKATVDTAKKAADSIVVAGDSAAKAK